ncbi:MAG: nicotinamide riboside transporter PnuC [Parvularculaceae bacterium]
MVEFLQGMFGARAIEIAAVCLGLANIALLARRNIWNYPFGIAMVTIYAGIFFREKLYSDAGLQVFFLIVQAYGWWYWSRARDDDGLVIVERLQKGPASVYAAAAVISAGALGYLMKTFTDAAFPFWDASIAVLSVVAQIMLARRRLENWLVWIAVDVLAIGLYLEKGLQPTAALYAIFLVMCVVGFANWRNAWRAGVATA